VRRTTSKDSPGGSGGSQELPFVLAVLGQPALFAGELDIPSRRKWRTNLRTEEKEKTLKI